MLGHCVCLGRLPYSIFLPTPFSLQNLSKPSSSVRLFSILPWFFYQFFSFPKPDTC